MKRLWAGMRRSDRGAGSLEYLGIIVFVAILVGGLVAAVNHFRIGDQLACHMRAAISQEERDCSTQADPVHYADGEDVGNGQDDFLAGPNDREPGESSGSADAEPLEPPEYFQHASNLDEEVDSEKVEQAVEDFDVNGGFLQRIFGGDGLRDVEDALHELNGAEIDAYFDSLTDAEIREWLETMGSNWTQGEQRAILQHVAAHASATTLDRLSEHTSLLQPDFTDVDLPSDKEEKLDKLDDIDEWHWSELEHQLFVDGASPHDVSQGGLGNCWYMASLMSTAHQQPEILEDAIILNPNGTYEVRLYDEDGEPIYYTVDPRLVVDENGNEVFHDSLTRSYENGAGEPVSGIEAWPAIMEKALAMHMESYGAIEGGQAARGLEAITGVPSEQYDTDGEAPSIDELSQMLDEGSMVSFSSLAQPESAESGSYTAESGEIFYYSHAYVLQSVDKENGTVTLWNPWGTDRGKLTIPADEYSELFKRVDVNDGWAEK